MIAALFEKYAQEMYDRSNASEETKRARALFHIESILKNNSLTNAKAGLEEVTVRIFIRNSVTPGKHGRSELELRRDDRER